MTAKAALVFIPFLLAAVLPAAGAETTPAAKPTRASIRHMMSGAHTAGEYQSVAEYFRSRQKDFTARAKDERAEWIRREQVPFSGLAMKYPQPEMSSRYRYEYFAYEAAQMGKRADRFEHMAMAAAIAGHDDGARGGE